MIKLMDMLREGSHKEKNPDSSYNSASWLDPRGIFYPIKSGSHHVLDAIKYAPDGTKYPTVYLYKKGWIRVVTGSRVVYAGNSFKKPTNIQLRILIDLAIDLERDEVLYDDRDGHFITLWDKNHQLE